MARIITRELADRIARKLEAAIDKSASNHDIAKIYHDGKLIAFFGNRRGSEKDKGHDHIPGQLHVGPRFGRDLGLCPRSKADWIAAMIAKGIIAE